MPIYSETYRLCGVTIRITNETIKKYRSTGHSWNITPKPSSPDPKTSVTTVRTGPPPLKRNSIEVMRVPVEVRRLMKQASVGTNREFSRWWKLQYNACTKKMCDTHGTPETSSISEKEKIRSP